MATHTILHTPAEIAARLRMSRKTLAEHVRSGALRYVSVGHGTKRPRKMFTDADVDEFIERQTRREVPCPSTNRKARRSTTSTFSGEVLAFTALRNERIAAKPKP
jgi:hypothetical protein